MNKSNLKWAGRTALILLLVCGLDAAVVMLVPHPRLWAALIPALIPMLTAVFVLIPMFRQGSLD